MKRFIKLVASLAICLLTLAGCSGEVVPQFGDTDVILLKKDGTVYSHLISDFNKEYYDVDELTSMAVKDASEYNKAHQDGTEVPMSVVEVTLIGNDKVKLTHQFLNAQAYNDYNGNEMFYGTVEEAVAKGYDLSALLTDVKTGEPLDAEVLMKKADKIHVLITAAKARIYSEQKITHVGDGVKCLEDGSVDTTMVEGTVVVLMK